MVTLLIAVGGPPLARIALLFHSADYVSVMLLGLVSAVVLAHGSVLKAIGMIVLGVLFGLVGTDVSTGEYRMTIGLDIAVRRDRLRADLDGPVRARRDHDQPRERPGDAHARRAGAAD